MSTAIRYLRLYLHTPTQGRRPIGYLSQYGDILRLSFDAAYIADTNLPTLSLGYQGGNDATCRLTIFWRWNASTAAWTVAVSIWKSLHRYCATSPGTNMARASRKIMRPCCASSINYQTSQHRTRRNSSSVLWPSF